jgi:hypothetical protein
MGRPRLLDKKLIKKISEKLGKPEISVVKSVSAHASRRKIPSEVALILAASKHKIGTSSAIRKLTPHQQAQLNGELNNGNNKTDNQKVRATKKTISLPKEVWDEFSDPYLGDTLYKTIPMEGYAIMFILENSIRSFISRILMNTYGSSWWDNVKTKKSLEDVVKKVDGRKSKDSENWYHSKRGVHEIYYTDYPELLQLMRSLSSDFQNYFKKGSEKSLLDKLSELSPTRNVIAHNNPITKDDFERLKVHSKDWFKYMQHLHNSGS